MVFGTWLSWLYAFLADEVNRVYLPDIPLPDPQGGVLGYYGGAILVGLLVGLVCTWPDKPWLGAIFGGLIGALLAFIALWQPVGGLSIQTLGNGGLTATAFVTLAVILTPIAFLMRISVERLQSSGASFSLRGVWLPVLVTGLVAFMGMCRLYPREVRAAFYSTRSTIEAGMNSSSPGQLPDALRDVRGFIPNANGRYKLEWSDKVDLFSGFYPQFTRDKRDFLIIARYTNGFAVACLFSYGASQPPCANFQ